MKKSLCIALSVLLLALALAGCGKKESAPALPFTAQNDIFTYDKIDRAKTQIVVSRTGNIGVEPFCKEFERLNPDIQVIYIDITGGNTGCKPLIDWVKNGYSPDVVISAADFFNGELTVKYFENLTVNPIIENFEAAALARTATNDEIYWLPGPSNVTAMMYNKTLFEQYGWEVPKTFDDFIALCVKIREDTSGEVEPWNPNAKYENELKIALEAFVYEEVFGGVENRLWYNAFTRGEETFQGHMEPYYEAIQTLVDNGILRPEHFSYSATARGKEFAAGKIAMINMNIYDADNDEYKFGYMPFPTTKGELGYLCDKYSSFFGIPKKERTEKETEAVRRFVEYFSSPEGQKAYIDQSIMVSNVKDVTMNSTGGLIELQPAISEGHMFALIEFENDAGGRCNYNLYNAAKDIADGVKRAEDCILDTVGKPAYTPPEEKTEAQPEIVAVAKQDMTILETSFYIADAYREAAGADIGLILNNDIYRGNVMRVFKGDISPSLVTVLKPRSFPNDSTLVKLSMTGKQLLDALSAPLGDGSALNAVYAYSGLKCEVAPWNEAGKKMLSVTLSDGSAIDPGKIYTVAAWGGTVDDVYITETLESIEGSFEEILTAKLKKDGEIAPATDGRIKLIWQ